MKRLKAALRTNNAQRSAVLLLTGFNLLACATREDCPWWLWLAAGLFYPALAFLFNLSDPIPE